VKKFELPGREKNVFDAEQGTKLAVLQEYLAAVQESLKAVKPILR